MRLKVSLVTVPMISAVGLLHAETLTITNAPTSLNPSPTITLTTTFRDDQGNLITPPTYPSTTTTLGFFSNNEPEPTLSLPPTATPSGTYILPPTIEPSGTTLPVVTLPPIAPSGTQLSLPSITNETPNSTGMAVATVNVGNLVGNNIMSRVTGGTGSGISTGDAMNHRGLWMQGFGNFTNQESKGGLAGYNATTGGATVGVDTDELVEGVTLGTALSYANSTVDSKASNNASTDADSYMVSLYGSKDYASGFYVAGQAGLGFNNYDSQRRASGAATDTTADFDSYQYTGRIDAGVNLPFAYGSTFTPLASAQFTHLDLDSYTEQGPSALQVDKSTFDTADLGIGGKLAWDWPLANGYTLKPNVRAKYILTVGDRTLITTNRFVGNGSTFTTQGIEADSSAVNLGAGLLIANAQATDVTLDYDADLRSSLIGHALQVKVRMPF